MEKWKGRLSTQKTIKCLLRRGLVPLRPACPSQSLPCLERKEAGGPQHFPESLAPMSASLSGSPHHCHHLPRHPCPHRSVTPVTTLVTTGTVLAFTCNPRDK